MTFDSEKSDAYYDNNQLDELENYLNDYYCSSSSSEKKKKNDPEVLWRYARLLHRKTEGLSNNQKKVVERSIRRGLDLIDEALEILRMQEQEEVASSSFASCYKWKALLLGALGQHVPIKEKIQNAFLIKELFLKSLDIVEDDPVVFFGMGEWCYRVASTGYVQRKIAATVFATPPESSYEEAVEWYRKSIRIRPEFKRCYYALGEALWSMGRKDEAKHDGYKKCVEIESKLPIEYEIDKLARKRLK